MIIKTVKYGITALLVLFIVFLLNTDNVRDVDMEELKKTYASEETLTGLTKGDDLSLRRFFNIDASEIQGYIYYRSASLMSVDEMLIIKAQDEESAKSLEENCKERLQVLQNNFTGYGTDQLTFINSAVTEIKGYYLFYSASPNTVRWEKIFKEAVKK